jgi:transcriptional regulator with XRE-family HTH domain
VAGQKLHSGERLREVRQAKGLSHRALAQMIGTNFRYIFKIEMGKLD